MPPHESQDDHLLPSGYRLEEFEIVRVLGEGGFGIAYLAFDHTLRQQRVIKEFLPGQVARRDRSGLRITARTGQENRDIFSEGLRSFISEARLLASMDHPNVVRVYRCLEANGTAYLVMHYYEGQTLKQRLEALNGTRPEADWVLRLLSAVLRGLQVVHDHGILHRDLKPDNIYLLADDRPVLIDFGAARRVVGGRTKALTGVITEGYSPIEQYLGDGGLQEGPWTDLYALGATGYWLVSGRKPWNAVLRMAGDQLPPALTLGQDLYPPTLLASLDRALEIQPQNRYRTAAEWLAALEDPTARVGEGRRRPRAEPPQAPPPVPEPVKPVPEPPPPVSPPKSAPPPPPAPEPPSPPLAQAAGDAPPRSPKPVDAEARPAPAAPAPDRSPPPRREAPSGTDRRSPDPAPAASPTGHALAVALVMLLVGGLFLVWLAQSEQPSTAPTPERPVAVTPRPAPPPPAPRASPTPPPVASESRWISGELLVNVRSGPGPEHRAITQLPRGSEVTWLGASTENPAWQRIRLSDGRVAYVHGNLLSRQRIAAAPTDPPAARQSFEPELVRLPGGCFQMGSPASEAGRDSDERQHRVCVEAFEIGKYEVTQGEWRAVMGNNPSHFKNGDRYPVERVSWNDVQDYLQRLNQRTGQPYRLPTEAEWEYACRGGVEGQRYCGGNDVDRVAWYTENSGGQTQPVGRKAANGFGLYDLSGNVWEWTCSLYDQDYNGAETRCIDKVTSGPRSLRGGSWLNLPARVRSANCDWLSPAGRDYGAGFRLARSL